MKNVEHAGYIMMKLHPKKDLWGGFGLPFGKDSKFNDAYRPGPSNGEAHRALKKKQEEEGALDSDHKASNWQIRE
eukprot:SAG11_NODE_94_length_17057_cov_255.471754_10_plen_75_part_00